MQISNNIQKNFVFSNGTMDLALNSPRHPFLKENKRKEKQKKTISSSWLSLSQPQKQSKYEIRPDRRPIHQFSSLIS